MVIPSVEEICVVPGSRVAVDVAEGSGVGVSVWVGTRVSVGEGMAVLLGDGLGSTVLVIVISSKLFSEIKLTSACWQATTNSAKLINPQSNSIRDNLKSWSIGV